MGEAGGIALPAGRPPEFTQEIADAICSLLAEGNSLRTIAEMDDMPSRTTIRRWRQQRPDFDAQYARAREEQADSMFEDILHIADTDKDTHAARLKVDSRKWVLSKMLPKKYGDKLEQTVKGDPNTPLEVVHDFAPLAPERQPEVTKFVQSLITGRVVDET